MEVLTGLFLLVFVAAVAGVVWLGLRSAKRENERLNAEAVDTFKSPGDASPLGSGGGPKPVK